MRYSVRRFSMEKYMRDGNEYILSQVDSGLGGIEDLTGKIMEDERLRDLRPVRRHVKLVNNLSKLLRRKKKQKNNSETPQTDPTTTINTSEANKFKVAINRLSNSMGNDSSNNLVE